jgi:hypothetical protein
MESVDTVKRVLVLKMENVALNTAGGEFVMFDVTYVPI